jgi:nucleoside-diphosphate-sugar epimerase
MKQPRARILVLGSEHFAASQVNTALEATEWATPVPYRGSSADLAALPLDDIHGIFNGTTGRPEAVLATAEALHRALERTGRSVRVVHLSSMTVYGSAHGEVGEDAPLRSDIGAYGAAQVQAEAWARNNPRHVILRPGCEYGPGCPEWSVRIARLLDAHRLGDLGAAGDGTCNLLFMPDLVAGALAALQAPEVEGRAFNLAMRSPPTWNEYFLQFARALGAVPVVRIGARRRKIERKLLAPVLKGLELLERRLPGGSRRVPPAITPSLLDLCGQPITLSVAEAERTLGLRWTPLSDGLARTAAAYRAA